MLKPATVTLTGVRTNALSVPFVLTGLDLTDYALAGVVVQNWDNDPGSPEIALPMLGGGDPAGTTGFRLDSVDTSGAVPISYFSLYIAQSDMAAIGAAAEVGSDLTWKWTADLTPDGGDAARFLQGDFRIGGALGSSGSVSLALADEIISVSIDGADLLAPLVAAAGAAASAAEAARDTAIEAAAGYFRVYDFNGLKPIDDTLGAGGSVNAIYCPRASIYTKRNGVQASFTLTNSDSTEWPGYAKLTFSSAHQFFYIDLDDSTFKSVTYSGGLPTYPNLDTMIPIAMAVQGRLIWFVDCVMADDIDRPTIIWAAPLVVEISVTNTILRVPAFYYKEGTGLYTLISPRIPAGFTATPKYTELTFSSASATRIWFDYKQYIADPTQAYIKTAVGNVSPITRKFKGVMLAKAFNGAIECAQAVVGDAPGGQVANQFAYSRDITALPIDRYSFLVGSSFYTISNAAVTAMGLTTGVQNTTADKRPSIEWLIPEAHGGCEFFVSIIVDSAVANDFGTPQVATYAGTTVRGSTQTMTLEKQFDQYTARYTLKGLMPNFADIDRIRIVGTNPNSITGLKWAGLQWHHGGGAAPYIRTTDIFGPLPVAARMTLAETSLTDLNKVLTSGSFGARGRPVSNATSTTDLLILGDSKATDGQGFANELAALYPGRSTTKNAVAGQASFETALWAGKPGAVAAAFTLPASGGVTVTLTPNPFIGTPANPSSCKALIDGALGVLSWNGSVITFTRSAAGRSRTIAAGASFQIVSTIDLTGSTASASILHPTAFKRTLVINVGHNDLYLSPSLLNSSGRNGYTRAGFRENLLGIVNAANAANIHALVCGVHNGLKFLTDTRAQANGAGAGIGIAASDAITLAVLEEREANNAWMAATFEGYVDLLAAQKTAGNTVSIDLGSGAVFDVLSITAAADGIHGTDGGTLQTVDAAAIKAVGDGLGW